MKPTIKRYRIEVFRIGGGMMVERVPDKSRTFETPLARKCDAEKAAAIELDGALRSNEFFRLYRA
jgi:hypothetical protein